MFWGNGKAAMGIETALGRRYATITMLAMAATLMASLKGETLKRAAAVWLILKGVAVVTSHRMTLFVMVVFVATFALVLVLTRVTLTAEVVVAVTTVATAAFAAVAAVTTVTAMTSMTPKMIAFVNFVEVSLAVFVLVFMFVVLLVSPQLSLCSPSFMKHCFYNSLHCSSAEQKKEHTKLK